MFINPTKVERVTSGFRTPGRSGHHGVDFANPGTHDIFAVAAGTVTRSYTSASYGECIMIEHSISGQTWESVYAHMRSGSRKVSVGAKVKQGQVIGIMGNTGESTGQHLHFELHKGRWNASKSNAVDPLKYLGQKQSTATTTNTAVSIVDYLDSQKKDSSFANRAKLAAQHGIKNYKGTPDQNTALLNKLKGGATTPVQKKNTVFLPANAKTWRTYKTNVQPVKKNSDWSLTPSAFGGLTYDIVGKPYDDVVTINTTRGKRNIYVGKGTGAVVK